jgi:hypothetical protein
MKADKLLSAGALLSAAVSAVERQAALRLVREQHSLFQNHTEPDAALDHLVDTPSLLLNIQLALEAASDGAARCHADREATLNAAADAAQFIMWASCANGGRQLRIVRSPPAQRMVCKSLAKNKRN